MSNEVNTKVKMQQRRIEKNRGESWKKKQKNFRYRDSNPGLRDENPICYRLHHIGLLKRKCFAKKSILFWTHPSTILKLEILPVKLELGIFFDNFIKKYFKFFVRNHTIIVGICSLEQFQDVCLQLLLVDCRTISVWTADVTTQLKLMFFLRIKVVPNRIDAVCSFHLKLIISNQCFLMHLHKTLSVVH